MLAGSRDKVPDAARTITPEPSRADKAVASTIALGSVTAYDEVGRAKEVEEVFLGGHAPTTNDLLLQHRNVRCGAAEGRRAEAQEVLREPAQGAPVAHRHWYRSHGRSGGDRGPQRAMGRACAGGPGSGPGGVAAPRAMAVCAPVTRLCAFKVDALVVRVVVAVVVVLHRRMLVVVIVPLGQVQPEPNHHQHRSWIGHRQQGPAR